MDDLLAASYGTGDTEQPQNPYSRFQAVSGARLGPNGPVMQVDQTAYAYNDPAYYSHEHANLNNAGPAARYQPPQPGNGAGVFSAPSQFAPGYYLRVHNRSNRTMRVAKGMFLANGCPCFARPEAVDDTLTLHFEQATPGQKVPVLVEFPSKALYLKVVTIPTGQNQLTLYLPFESELVEQRAPVTRMGGYTIFADTLPDLQIASVFASQAGLSAQPVVTQPPPVTAVHPADITVTQPPPVTVAQPLPTTITPPVVPPASSGPSPLTSALMLGLGVLAARYLKDIE
jgi:hypothetical protein